ncbi:MAG TPA: TM0106 family RecB-like putative nuclease [Methyloceanibacter sp.]|nr:TM0106 family RecB-like putative nuclease [Methyloceanibacter sp.]
MSVPITASMLYDLVSCPHRVRMDLYGDPADRDEINPFVQMLWEKGSLHETEVIDGVHAPFLDLSIYSGDEKERRTTEAMRQGVRLIYSGRMCEGGLLGDPDLLRKEPGGYVAGDIKSGAGEEGNEDNRKPKKHYAVQIALYTDILERKGLSAGRHAFVWDVHGEEVPYDFDAPLGVRDPRTLWDYYRETLQAAQGIVNQGAVTQAAYSSGVCKFCHWYSACLAQLTAADDLTLIPELGRSKRDVMADRIATIKELASINPDGFMQGKKTVFPGIGADTLLKFHERAKLIAAGDQARPYLRAPVSLPASERELFFDIEVDPMRDHCYLHGFVERVSGDNDGESFVAFFADEDSEEAEREAFAGAWRYLRDSQPCAIYYYSKYERTIYRKLQERYPEVCTADEIEALFDPARAVDLYFDVVLKATEWPTRDYSIKTLAKYLGFNWRDTHPSGAASIEWFDRWIKTGDSGVKQRILDYNEDDCRATRVLLDGIRGLE